MRWTYYFLLLFASSVNATTLVAQMVGQVWHGYTSHDRFASLTQLSAQSQSGYLEHLVPYLMARGVKDDAAMGNLFEEDLFHIAHALSMLFEPSQNVLQSLFGKHYSLIERYDAQIDHVGREVFGPLSFYLPLLERMAPRLGLVHVKNLVFSSTQVVKVLQQHDPSLLGVTIGRAYFQSTESGKIKCLELFQASPLDEKSPQRIEATKERISLLATSARNSMLTPIDHLAIKLNSVDEVYAIHERIHELASATLTPYQKEVSHNPGDGSTETKVLMRDSEDSAFNKIVEFVYYQRLEREKSDVVEIF